MPLKKGKYTAVFGCVDCKEDSIVDKYVANVYAPCRFINDPTWFMFVFAKQPWIWPTLGIVWHIV